MSILKKIILTITSILFLINNSNAVENKILFKINNEIITSLDIFDELKYLVTLNNELRSIENAQKFEIAKNSLIREKIKEIELKKKVNEIKIEKGLLQNVLIDNFKKENFQSISDLKIIF